MRIKVTDQERVSERMCESTVKLALRHLREAGVVILENAVPLKVVKEVQTACFEAIENGRGREIRSPMEMPFLRHELLANPFALQVLEAAMGRKIALALYLIHASPPDGAGEQAERDPHRDGNHLFPELPCVLPVSGVFVDIPLVDFNLENGATKIWPGSHLIMDNPPSDVRHLGERGKHLPSLQATMPMGSLLLRDMRLWHARMPNRSGTIRPMLDMCYVRVFPHAHERFPIPPELKRDWPESARKLLRTG